MTNQKYQEEFLSWLRTHPNHRLLICETENTSDKIGPNLFVIPALETGELDEAAKQMYIIPLRYLKPIPPYSTQAEDGTITHHNY